MLPDIGHARFEPGKAEAYDRAERPHEGEQPKRAYAGGGPNTRTALRPPKAKEFDMA